MGDRKETLQDIPSDAADDNSKAESLVVDELDELDEPKIPPWRFAILCVR
jgi:hypothetical protein